MILLIAYNPSVRRPRHKERMSRRAALVELQGVERDTQVTHPLAEQLILIEEPAVRTPRADDLARGLDHPLQVRVVIRADNLDWSHAQTEQHARIGRSV